MYPLLFLGDRVRVRRCAAEELAVGDMVVFLDVQKDVPRLVAHRLLRVGGEPGRRVLRTKGDANARFDPPLAQSAVMGRIEAIVTFGRVWRLDHSRARRVGLAAALAAPAFYASRRVFSRFCDALRAAGAAGAAATLFRARRAVLAGVSLDFAAADAAVETAPDGFFGFLSRDETWSGRVRLGGDVFVPPGVALTLAPGTVIEYAADSLWNLLSPVGRGGPCSLHVAGRFTAEGAAGARIRLGGPGAWGGLRLHPGATASLRACDASGGRDAGIFADGARLLMEDCRLEGADGGVRAARGEVELRGCCVTGSAGSGVQAEAGARLSMTGCRLEGNRTGLEARGARVTLASCAFSGNANAGALVFGGTLDAEAARFDRNKDAGLLLAAGASAVLRGGGADGNRVGLAVNEASLSARGWSARDNEETGIDFAGGRGGLENVAVSGGSCGVRISSGVLEARGLELADCDKGAVLSGGELRWDGAEASGGVIEVGPGARATLDGVEGRPSEPGSGVWRRALVAFVLATRDLPGFAWVYDLLYRLPVRMALNWARRDPRVVTLFAHRSWATGRWRAGTSDVDLVVVARDLSGKTGADWLSALRRRAAGWRRCFPQLGELLVMEPSDLDAYLADGGVRGRLTLPSEARVLHGAPLASEAAPRAALGAFDRFADRAHAYTRMMRWLADRGATPWAVARLQAQKALTELGAPADLRAPADLPSAVARAMTLFHHDALDVSSGMGAPQEARPQARREPPRPALEAEHRRFAASVEPLRDMLDGRLVAVCADTLYRSYFILEDEAMTPERLPRLLERLGEHAASRRGGGTLPVALSWSAWALWTRLPYLECPSLADELAGTAPGAVALTRAGRAFAALRRFYWSARALAVPRLDAESAARRDRECLASFRATWRFHASAAAGHSPAYVLHYLHSRAMGLRLAQERGVRAPFFELDEVAQLYREHFPQEMGGWDERWAAFPNRHESPEMEAHLLWIDRQLRSSRPPLHSK